MDDYLNIHSRAQLLVARLGGGAEPGPERLLVLDGRLSRDRGMPDDWPYGTVETMPNAAVGDVLSFFSPAEGTLRKLGTAKVTASEGATMPLCAALYNPYAIINYRDVPYTPERGGGKMKSSASLASRSPQWSGRRTRG
jgi:hypothetical protein